MEQDQLEFIFQRQAELMRRLNVPSLGGLYGLREPTSTTELLEWVNKSGEKLVHEGVEIKDWCPWKHWSQQLGNKDPRFKDPQTHGSQEHLDEIRMECIDALHFTVELSIILGIDATHFRVAYEEKNKVNHQRQESGTY